MSFRVRITERSPEASEDADAEQVRRSRHTGRPLGTDAFVRAREQKLRRPLAAGVQNHSTLQRSNERKGSVCTRIMSRKRKEGPGSRPDNNKGCRCAPNATRLRIDAGCGMLMMYASRRYEGHKTQWTR